MKDTTPEGTSIEKETAYWIKIFPAWKELSINFWKVQFRFRLKSKQMKHQIALWYKNEYIFSF